jgi:type IV secretion system protein VirD4
MVRLKEWWEAQRQFGKGPTARLAGLVEVLSNRYLRGDVFLGRPKLPIGGLMRPIGIPTEKHMVTIAEPGAGKSTAALIPNLCIHQGSLLCIDPKGELATIRAQRRGAGGGGVEGMGQGVFVLDPFGTTALPGESAAYNVFDELARVAEYDADRPVSYAGLIADALVHRRDGQEAAYWDNAAHTLVRGLVLYILAHEPPERRHLVRLRQLLMEGDIDGHAEAVAAGAIKAGDLTPFDVLVERMREARDGPYGEAIAGAASSLITMSPNQMGGVVTTAQEHTAFLDAPEIARLCRHSDFLLEDLKASWISVYLCMPVTMVSGKEGRWLRMFVLLFIDMMVRVPAPPPIPVLLAIDEFPSLGRLEGIDVVAPVLRSYGVRFWAIAQDVGQLERVYKDVWGGFIGGAEAVQFMGIKHPDTVKLVVSLLGEHEVKRQRSDGRQWRTSEEVKPVLDAEQVSRLLNPRNGNQIVWRGSRRPLLLKATPYFKYLPARYYSPDPRYKEAWNRRWWREAS